MSTARANIKSEISADMSQFSATLRRASMAAAMTGKNIARGMASAAKGVARLGVAASVTGAAMAALAGAGVARGIKAAADLGGKVSDLSAQTGVAAGNILVMQRALADNGISADKVGTIINKLQRSIYEAGQGIGTAIPAFEALELNLSDLARMSPEKQFETIQKKIAAIEDPTKRAGIAMQIFGRSGGELLTLFASGKAFDNAGKFVGSQAEILNRSANTFDSIADKLARIPDKLTGFFVGLLDPIADNIDAALSKFDDFDFAAVGQRLSNGFKLENLGPGLAAVMEFATVAFGEGLTKAIQIAGALMTAVFSKEGMSFIGGILQDIFIEAINSIGNALFELSKTIKKLMSGEVTMKDNTRIIGTIKPIEEAPKTFADRMQEAIASVDFAPSDRMKDAKDKFTKTLGDIFPELPKKAESGSQSDIYDAEREAQRKRVAEDMATMKEQATPIEIFGPSKSLISKPKLPALGSDNVFARDRARLGLANGLSTGGLGAKRAFGQLSKDKGMKKSETLQEKSVTTLESIDQKISQSLTVA
jgi:hypothetical protein